MPVSKKCKSARSAEKKVSTAKTPKRKVAFATVNGDEIGEELRRDPKKWAAFKERMRLMSVHASTAMSAPRAVNGVKCKVRDFSCDIMVNGWTEIRKYLSDIPQFPKDSKLAKGFDIWRQMQENFVAIAAALDVYGFIFNHSTEAGADNKFFDMSDVYDVEFLRDLRMLVGAYANLRDTREAACKYYFAYLQKEVRGIVEAINSRTEKYIKDGLADGSTNAMLKKLPYVTLANKEGFAKPDGKKGSKGKATAASSKKPAKASKKGGSR